MANELDENWLPVPGYEGAYSVSDAGRVRSEPRKIADSKAHGTFSEAECHPCALLTDAQALAIYSAVGAPAEILAAETGVSVAVVNQIWRGDSWASVTGGRNVSAERGAGTYARTILTRPQADIALSNRANRAGRKDGRGIKPTAAALGVDADVIKALYAAADAGKPIVFAQ